MPAHRSDIRIALRHPALRLDGAAGGVHDTTELDQNSVAGAFNDTAAVLRDRRLQKFAAVGVEPGERPSSSAPMSRL
jgi:hypothetical protein